MGQQYALVEKLKTTIAALPDHVKLIAVSKTHPAEVILNAYNAGQKIFGENKVQELVAKYTLLPKDIEWHMIGHLQTNKVKDIAAFISYIHSVDSIKLLEAINKEASKNNRIIKCLLEVHIAKEDSKFGLKEEDVIYMFTSEMFKNYSNIKIAGLMGMATFTNDHEQVRNEFKKLSNLFKLIKKQFLPSDNGFSELSIGMSDDYQIAIEEGSTMVRLGTILFGKRTYNQK